MRDARLRPIPLRAFPLATNGSIGFGAALVLPALALSAVSYAADMSKTLRVTFQVAETGFDPTRTSDYYSGMVIEAIFDRLLTYDYLARPAKLVPLAGESLPQNAARAVRYSVRARPGDRRSWRSEQS